VIYKYKGFEASAYKAGDGFRLNHLHGDEFPEPETVMIWQDAERWIESFNNAASAQKIRQADRENALRLLGFEGNL
jgi:hypothetical protein